MYLFQDKGKRSRLAESWHHVYEMQSYQYVKKYIRLEQICRLKELPTSKHIGSRRLIASVTSQQIVGIITIY